MPDPYPFRDVTERHVRRCAARAKARRDRRLALRRVRDRDIAKAINRFKRIDRLVGRNGPAWATKHKAVILSVCGRGFREVVRAGEDRPRFAERAKDIGLVLFFALDLRIYDWAETP